MKVRQWIRSILLLAATPAWAGAARDVFYEYAPVLRAEPVYEQISVARPQRECNEEQVYVPGPRSHTPVILGGIVGGVLGHNLGHHSGAATAAGTLLGASIGRDVSLDRRTGFYQTEERCSTRKVYQDEDRLAGYRVTYRYHGQTYVTRTAEDPGDRIRIRVAVTPDDYDD
jgi:uncharacterized protein YcfJ